MATKRGKGTTESGPKEIAEGRRALGEVDYHEITEEEYPRFLDRLLTEWRSEADEKAFSGL